MLQKSKTKTTWRNHQVVYTGGPDGDWNQRVVSGFEPLKINFTHFWICRTAKAFTFSPESNLNIDKNRSTMPVGGFLEICAPSWICSEPPSLESGENTVQKDYINQEFNWNQRNRQENLYLQLRSHKIDKRKPRGLLSTRLSSFRFRSAW